MSRRDRELKSYALFKCLSLSGVFDDVKFQTIHKILHINEFVTMNSDMLLVYRNSVLLQLSGRR